MINLEKKTILVENIAEYLLSLNDICPYVIIDGEYGRMMVHFNYSVNEIVKMTARDHEKVYFIRTGWIDSDDLEKAIEDIRSEGKEIFGIVKGKIYTAERLHLSSKDK